MFSCRRRRSGLCVCVYLGAIPKRKAIALLRPIKIDIQGVPRSFKKEPFNEEIKNARAKLEF